MNIIIGADHGGVRLKADIMTYLESRGHSVRNMGVDTEESVDYPDVASRTCAEFMRGDYDFGILVCGTGLGVSIAANKIHGIRCGQIFDTYTAVKARAHNNANFIAFGGRNTYHTAVTGMIETYMSTEFEGGRHGRRVGKITELEKSAGTAAGPADSPGS